MENWLLGLIIGLSVTAALLLLCFAIAWRQRQNANRSINEASKLRLLPENAPTGEGVPYTMYHNHFMGGWLQLLDGYPRMNAVNVYNLTLDHVDTVFKGKRQPWCRTYKAACQIFGPGNGPKMVRQGIHAEHSMLYRTTGVARTSKGKLFSGRELIALIKDGRSAGEMVFFTYVVLPNGEWHFSHTGRHPLRDGLSKHAVHANAAREVVYAGEFHVKDGAFILDNNSGTFSPNKDDLPLVKELIERNFPGLTVEAWDFRDPRLIADLEAAPTRAEGKKKDTQYTAIDISLDDTLPQTPKQEEAEEVPPSSEQKSGPPADTSMSEAPVPAPATDTPRSPEPPLEAAPKELSRKSSASSKSDAPNPLSGTAPTPKYPCLTSTKVNLNDL